jgi:uncharacterized protein (DUF1330 family)
MKAKKLIIVTVISFIAVSVAAGWYLYNKGPKNVLNSNGIEVQAANLYKSYISDSSTAQKKFGEQVVEVAGVVKKVEENTQKQQVILLQTDEDGGSVNCTMEEKNIVAAGNKVVLKGICTGIGEGDEDLGLKPDVYLIRAYLIK